MIIYINPPNLYLYFIMTKLYASLFANGVNFNSFHFLTMFIMRLLGSDFARFAFFNT